MKLNTQYAPDQQRFHVEVDGHRCVLDFREAGNSTLDLHHTGVPDALSGRGIGTQLVRDALNWCGQNGTQVIPSCPFVADVIRRYPQYGKLVARRVPEPT